MNEDLTRQLLRRIAALERRLGIVETSEAGAAHSHSSYLNRDGSVALTGDWDIGAGRKVSAATLAARDAAGLSLQDDGGNVALKVNDGGTLTMGKVVNTLEAPIFRSLSAGNLADDTVYSWTPLGLTTSGFLMITATNSATYAGIIAYRAASSPFASILVGGTGLAVTTGVLTGTTGTDGKVTFSAASDGTLYVENRSGVVRTLPITIF